METSIPILTTQETVKIRQDYPSIEHLEAGNIASWLIERQDQLLIRAKGERAGMNLAKVITLAGATVGTVCYATSPLATIGAAIAGLGYVWSVVQDITDNHQFAPLPFIRGDFLEFLSAMGDSEERAKYFARKNELADLMMHLEPLEKHEFAMLNTYLHTLTEYLTQVEQGKRFYAYRWLSGCFSKFKGQFPSKEELGQHLAHVEVSPQINYQIMSAIAETQKQPISLPQVQIITHKDNADNIEPKTKFNSYQPQGELNLVESFTDHITNSLIIGLPGSGKGLFTSNAGRAAKRKHEGLIIVGFDPKNDSKETGYFEGMCDHLFRADTTEMEVGEVVEWFKDCYSKFRNIAREQTRNGGRTLAMLDEGTQIGNKFVSAKDTFLKDQMVSLTSCGDSKGWNVWAIAQAPHVGNLGFAGDIRSQLTVLAILNQTNIGAINNWWKTGVLGDKQSDDYLKKLIAQSEVGRCFYFGKTNNWYSMPKLHNYSGYDRDSRKFIDTNTAIAKLEGLYNHSPVATKLSVDAESLLGFLQRTGRNKAVIQEIQPNFKVKGDRFSAEDLKRLFNELVEHGLSVWLDATTIEITQN
ncbi:hypothetical protein [Nostoc sp. PCC 7107]|uniref:hypothetical protein n=1 Tax=Nostoc sp. PCC 7107 TaxID=317936 RepID=UPI00029EE145|nr:hypothetical protein [Nostoc sp. PCC 7107]AFY45473.1 hypothetical protein Nos7107_4955 [Nostoc sp. PCC 7107]